MKPNIQTKHRPAPRLFARVARALTTAAAPVRRVRATIAALIAMTATLALAVSCDILQQIQGTANMVNCKYDYRSLTDVTVAGVDVSRGLSLSGAPKILGLLASGGSSLPIACTVNLDVQNPGTTDALMNGMEYALAIDGVHFTSGSTAHRLSVAPGGSGVLPLALSFDVAQLLRGESRDAVIGVVRNLAGLGGIGGGNSEPSRVTLSLRPSFDVGGRPVASPVAIPVNFSFGGK